MDMWMTKENGMSFDDFDSQKVVLISDEAHHLNVDTKKEDVCRRIRQLSFVGTDRQEHIQQELRKRAA